MDSDRKIRCEYHPYSSLGACWLCIYAHSHHVMYLHHHMNAHPVVIWLQSHCSDYIQVSHICNKMFGNYAPYQYFNVEMKYKKWRKSYDSPDEGFDVVHWDRNKISFAVMPDTPFHHPPPLKSNHVLKGTKAWYIYMYILNLGGNKTN